MYGLIASPLKQSLHERASIYIASLPLRLWKPDHKTRGEKTWINKQKLPSILFSICDKATLKSVAVTQSASVHCSATANDIPVMGSFLTAIKLRTFLSSPF